MARPPAPLAGDVARPAVRTGRPSGASSSGFARATCALGTTVLGLALLLGGGVPTTATPVSAPPHAQGALDPPKSGVVTRTPRTEAPSAALGPLVGNPFSRHAPWVPPDSPAVEAAASIGAGPDAELLDRLAGVPTATWLLPEIDPLGIVGERVRQVVGLAHAEGRVPVLVVYGVPGRDCVDGHSSGGLPLDEYRDWLREIVAAAGPGAVVVLEPDALASGNACSLPADRLQVLREAVGIVAASGQGPVTYVDAGHSGWLDADTAVARLRQVGVERVRGFSLNVAGYGHEALERAYGDRLAARLGGSAHYVVDTGRAGHGSNGEWCNPAGRALGAEPAAVFEQGPMDARLWIKPPGESDGPCGGGPEAGTFWTERALEMARAAGW